jgi:hypothetical protein
MHEGFYLDRRHAAPREMPEPRLRRQLRCPQGPAAEPCSEESRCCRRPSLPRLRRTDPLPLDPLQRLRAYRRRRPVLPETAPPVPDRHRASVFVPHHSRLDSLLNRSRESFRPFSERPVLSGAGAEGHGFRPFSRFCLRKTGELSSGQ